MVLPTAGRAILLNPAASFALSACRLNASKSKEANSEKAGSADRVYPKSSKNKTLWKESAGKHIFFFLLGVQTNVL